MSPSFATLSTCNPTRTKLWLLILSIYCIAANGLQIPISPTAADVNEKVKSVDLTYLQDKILQTITAGNIQIPSELKELNDRDPLVALPFIAEITLNSVNSATDKAILVKIFSFLITTLNENMKNDFSQQIVDNLSNVTSFRVQQNDINVVKSVTSDLSDAYGSFAKNLLAYLSASSNKTVDERNQVFNSFDVLVSSIVRKQQLLLDLEKSAGLPFYLNTASLLVSAHIAILGNAASLGTNEDYFTSNYNNLKEYIDKFNGNVYNTTRSHIYNEFNGTWSKSNQYIRGIYTSGLSLYQAVVKMSYELEYNVPFKRWNSLELYHEVDDDIVEKYHQKIESLGSHFFRRVSMLRRIDTYSYKDAVLRFTFTYYDALKNTVSMLGQRCSGIFNHKDDVLENAEFYQLNNDKQYLAPIDVNPAVKYVTEGVIKVCPKSNSYVCHKDSYMQLSFFALYDSNDRDLIKVGNSAGMFKRHFNIPGYFFNGIDLDYSEYGTNICNIRRYDTLRLYISGTIFSHYDGFIVQALQIENTKMKRNVAYELDLYHGFLPALSQYSNQAYADPVVGKNCIVVKELAVFVIPSDDVTATVSDPRKFTLLVQCASVASSQIVNVTLRLGDAFNGTEIAKGSVRIGEAAFDKKLRKITPLIDHVKEKRNIPFITHAVDLDYSLTENITGRNLFVQFSFEVSNTIISEVTLIVK